MATFWQMLGIQSVLIFYVILGVVAVRTGIIDDNSRKGLTRMIVELLIPVMIFKSFLNITWEIMGMSISALVIGFVIYILITIFGGIFYKDLPAKQSKILHYATLVNSAGFTGLPIVLSLFGEVGSILAAVYLIPHRIFAYTIGISLLVKQEQDIKQFIISFMTNPMILAVVFGLILGLSPITLPDFLMEALAGVSGTVSPLSMIAIGSILGAVSMKDLFEPGVIRFVLVRMVILPIIVLLTLKLLAVDPQVTGMCVVMATMPAGATTPILAAKYDLDVALSSKLTFVSIILSLILSPLFLTFV